jgi:hypothetical protein
MVLLFTSQWPAWRKWWELCGLLFKENDLSATYLPDFKISVIAPCRFSNALFATRRNLSSKSIKGF